MNLSQSLVTSISYLIVPLILPSALHLSTLRYSQCLLRSRYSLHFLQTKDKIWWSSIFPFPVCNSFHYTIWSLHSSLKVKAACSFPLCVWTFVLQCSTYCLPISHQKNFVYCTLQDSCALPPHCSESEILALSCEISSSRFWAEKGKHQVLALLGCFMKIGLQGAMGAWRWNFICRLSLCFQAIITRPLNFYSALS